MKTHSATHGGVLIHHETSLRRTYLLNMNVSNKNIELASVSYGTGCCHYGVSR